MFRSAGKWLLGGSAMTKGKVPGTGNGNRYLACVYSEASDYAKRYDEAARKFFNRKLKSTNAPIAHNALANKLSRATYYIMGDGVDFISEKAFA
jgi:transposase